MLLFAAAETWWGVLGGLIPIIGLALIGYVIGRAVRDNDSSDEEIGVRPVPVGVDGLYFFANAILGRL